MTRFQAWPVALALTASSFTLAASNEELSAPATELRIVTDQAEAALELLDRRSRGETIRDSDWQHMLATEGYQRLERRQRSFGQEDFEARLRAFLVEDEGVLERRAALRLSLAGWSTLNLREAADRALAYLPAGSAIRGTIYPVIKHTTNSFVFELDTDPAVFFYLDPETPAPKVANTLAHELHHIGGSINCPQPAGYEELSESARDAVDWLSGFGEGLAMLAAAGGPDIDPHATSTGAERSVWERDLSHFAEDIRRLEAFFASVAAGELSAEERRRQGFTFINTEDVPQGAFYTVGWKMAADIERARGREPVIASVCDPRILLTSFNEVAGEAGDPNALPWSSELIETLYGR